MRHAIFAVASAATIAWTIAALPAKDVERSASFERNDDGGALLIDVADHLSDAERTAFLSTLPGEPQLNSIFSDQEGLYRLQLTDAEADALTDQLAGNDAIEFIERDATYQTFGGADDPLYPFQWHFDAIGLEDAWDGATGNGVTVAVIDTGVAFADAPGFRRVQDLDATRMVAGYDFVSDDDQPHDEHGHGTHVAGTVAQTTNNAYGGAGVAPNAQIMPIRVLDASGRGNTADIAESIRWAADNGADVINLSLGGPMPSRIMQDAVTYAHGKGVTVIAAAGNNGWSRPSYPAAYRNVVAVAATQFDGNTTFYSNYGNYIDIAAPGGNTRVDQNDDGRPDGVLQETLSRGNPAEHEFALYMGTSMASPHVAGVAALIHELGVTHPDRVEELLKDSALNDMPNYDTKRFGAGSLRADNAVAAVTSNVQVPRSFAAFFFALFAIAGATRSRRGARAMSTGAVAAAAVFATSGFALFAAIGNGLGLDVSMLAPLSASVVRWPTIAGLSTVASSAVLLSAIPAITLYALFGTTKNRHLAGIVVGTMLGLGVFLTAEALAPMTDVTGVPGIGRLDQAWLALNGLLALAAGLVAMRRP